MHLVHAAPGRAPGSAHQHLKGAGSQEPAWLLSAPAYPGERDGNESPAPSIFCLSPSAGLWLRAEGLWGTLSGNRVSSLPADPRGQAD